MTIAQETARVVITNRPREGLNMSLPSTPEGIDAEVWIGILATVARRRREQGLTLTLDESMAIQQDSELESKRKSTEHGKSVSASTLLYQSGIKGPSRQR